MNTNSKRLGLYIAAMLILTSVATTLRTIACVTQLDYASGFFTDKSLIRISDIIICITVFGMFSYVLAATSVKLRASFSTGATYVSTGILAVATVFLGMKVISYVISGARYPLLSVKTLTDPTTVLGIITAILACLSVAHHFFNAFITDAKADVRAYFAMATVAFFTFYALIVYLDSSIAISDTGKILRQTAFLLCAIFFLFETRISLARESWRLYAAFGLIAASVSAYASVPAIITYYINGHIVSYAKGSLASIEEAVLLLTAFIFILSRLILTATLREEKENELIKVLKNYANDREERANESFERYQEIFASKQLSIFDLYGEVESSIEESPDEEPEEAEPEEQEKEITISDDAIYEAIFGKMPERPEPEEEAPEQPEEKDEREAEQIAEDLLNTVEEALREDSENKEKETDI